MESILGSIVLGWVIGKLQTGIPQWWAAHKIGVKKDISKVPGLSSLLQIAIRYAEQFKESQDGPARFKTALLWATSELSMLPIPAYIKVQALKILPQLLQEAFDAIPTPAIPPNPVLDNIASLAIAVAPAIINPQPTTPLQIQVAG